MNNYIGSTIKKIRLSKNMTQEQLALGICSVKHLSRIELNQSSPSVYLIYEFSTRLGNSLSQYIPYSDCPISYEAKNELDSLTLLYDQSHYLNVDAGIKNNAYLDLCESKLLQKEFAWLKGANAFHIMPNCHFNTDYFYQILGSSETDIFSLLAHALPPIDYRIINVICVLYLKEGNSAHAEKLLIRTIESIENSFYPITDTSYLRLLYNLARFYLHSNDLDACITYCDKGIKHCINTDRLSYLDHLSLIKGHALKKLGKTSLALLEYRTYINLHRDILHCNTDIVDSLMKKYSELT